MDSMQGPSAGIDVMRRRAGHGRWWYRSRPGAVGHIGNETAILHSPASTSQHDSNWPVRGLGRDRVDASITCYIRQLG